MVGCSGGGILHFSVSPRSLGFGFGIKGLLAKGLGPGRDNLSQLIYNHLGIGKEWGIN